jgi:hypothetical protein
LRASIRVCFAFFASVQRCAAHASTRSVARCTAHIFRRARALRERMEVRCSWSVGDAGLESAVVLREGGAEDAPLAPPLEAPLVLQPGEAGGPCELTGA